jgi:FtsH-binding integral membrane protein
MALSCVIRCCTEVFRKYALPIFIVFTILFALLVAISISNYKSKVIMLAAGLTFLLVVALTAYACKNKN